MKKGGTTTPKHKPDAMDKNMLIAIKKVLDEISAMSDEEFRLELEKHKDGDIANALRYACDSSFQPDNRSIS